MATPLGHLLFGAGIGARLGSRGWLPRAMVVGGLLGAAADLDFIPGLLVGAHARFHHAQSHSILAAIVVGALVYLVARPRKAAWGLIGGLGYASHLLLDLVTADDSTPYGIPLLWPLTSMTFQSPITVFPRVPHSEGAPLGHLAALAMIEIALCGGFLAWSVLSARRRGASRPPKGNHLATAATSGGATKQEG